jgi:hypothetical protein
MGCLRMGGIMAEAKDRKLNEATIKALPVPPKGAKFYSLAGRKIQGTVSPRGFGCRVMDKGTSSFALKYWNPAGISSLLGNFQLGSR